MNIYKNIDEIKEEVAAWGRDELEEEALDIEVDFEVATATDAQLRKAIADEWWWLEQNTIIHK